MRNFNATFALELAKEFLHMFYLVKIVLPVSGTKYYADFDVPVTYGGNVYISKNFSFQDIVLSSQMSVDSVGIEFDDVDGTISQLALTEDIRGAVVTMYVGVKMLSRGVYLVEEAPASGWLTTEDGARLLQEDLSTSDAVYCEEIFRGLIGEWRSKERMFTMTVVNEFILWQKRTLRLCQATCAWVFNKPPHTNLVVNGGFDSDTTGWTAAYSTIASVAGGQEGNCLEITTVSDGAQYAYRSFTTATTGKQYRVSFYVKSGTSGNELFGLLINQSGIINVWNTSGTSSGSWVNYTLYFTSIGTENEIIVIKNSATAGTMLFDSIELYEVNECAYLGSENWCDQSYDRCLALGNHLNFGGFRYLPACCEQELWWGKAFGER